MFGFRQIPITCEYCFVQLSSTDDPLEHVSKCKKVSSEKEVKRKVLLDEVCGKTTNDFSSDKAFSEHNNSHMGNLYKKTILIQNRNYPLIATSTTAVSTNGQVQILGEKSGK